MAQAKNNRIIVEPIKLTKTQRKILVAYLTQQKSIRATAIRLGMTTTKVYSLINTMVRHAATNGELDAESFLSKF